MSPKCFIDQIATQELMSRVTRMCGECYDDFKEGNHIYYDMQTYRYLCHTCYQESVTRLDERCETAEEGGGGSLFA